MSDKIYLWIEDRKEKAGDILLHMTILLIMHSYTWNKKG